jgi:hypothetical protein
MNTQPNDQQPSATQPCTKYIGQIVRWEDGKSWLVKEDGRHWIPDGATYQVLEKKSTGI